MFAYFRADGAKKTAATTTSVIETKPITQSSPTTPSSLEIKPSKTTVKISEKKGATVPSGNAPTNKRLTSNVEVKTGPPATILSSVVEVRGGGSPSSVVDVKQGPSSAIEIKAGASSTVEIRGGSPAVMSSKVEVREGTSTVTKVKKEQASKVEINEGPSSVVEVRAGPSKILFSHVEVVGGDIAPSVGVAENRQDHHNEVPTILSSVVEVRSSSEEPALSGNNVVEPEYDFLSRQPSEVVDETYKVSACSDNSRSFLRDILNSHGGGYEEPSGI
jgi:hypothetical protein